MERTWNMMDQVHHFLAIEIWSGNYWCAFSMPFPYVTSYLMP